MNTSIRGEKRRKKPRQQETCALCGRTGTRGFITRDGLRVCWAVPRCMERTLSEPEKPSWMPIKGPGPWTLTYEGRSRIFSGQVDFASNTFRVQLLRDGVEIPNSGVPVRLAVANGDTTSVKVFFVTNPTWTATSLGLRANGVRLRDGYGVLCYAGIGEVTVPPSCKLTIDSSGNPNPIFQMY